MKKVFIALLALITACQTGGGSGGRGVGNQLSGAAAPRLAAEQFLNAVRANDLQAMSLIWGTSQGPARNHMESTELEKRVIIMQCFYNHDKFRIISDLPGENGQRVIKVELIRAKISAQPSMYVIKGPSDRWYVQSLDMDAVKGFCG